MRAIAHGPQFPVSVKDRPEAVRQDMATTVWTIPNAISSLRIVACPIIIVLLSATAPSAIWLALAIMIVCEFSDYLDGYLARAYQQVSNVGKILDPMADSLFHVAVFLAFVERGWMPVWMLAVIALRDIVVSYLRLVAQQHIGTLAARFSGKLKTATQSAVQLLIVGLLAVYGEVAIAAWQPVISTALFVVTAIVLYTLAEYTITVYRGLN